ncbi:MAG TPA: hypothetical protein VF178_15265, partial [Gemmatimonadaceae bacterium]
QFCEAFNLECVPLLGTQVLPEDLLGMPKIEGDKTRFFPPALIAREAPYVLFLDELPAATPEVQTAFYSGSASTACQRARS